MDDLVFQVFLHWLTSVLFFILFFLFGKSKVKSAVCLFTCLFPFCFLRLAIVIIIMKFASCGIDYQV